MTDAKKTVEVSINVKGTNLDDLNKLATGFTNIGDAVKKASEAITALKGNLESVKAPDNLVALISSVQGFSKIKVPNIKQLAEGFERLAQIKSPPNLSNFASEVEKFSKIKVPNIKQLAQGLQLLTDSSLSMVAVGKRLRIVQRNLKGFSDINVPNITKIAKGLIELNKVAAINVSTKSLDALAKSLKALDGVKLPNFSNLIEGLKSIGQIKMDKPAASLKLLAGVLNQFADGRKLPAVQSLVTGLKNLALIDVSAVTKKIVALNTVLKNLDKGGYLKSFATFASDLNKVSSALGAGTQSVKNYTNAVKKADTATRGFGERIKNYFQYRIIADSVMNIKEAIVGSWEAIKDYDQALKDLQAITGATGLEVAQMGTTIKEVASTTKFSAAEVAQGMRTIGQAGFSAAEAMQTMQAVSNLATGTLSDMSTTVDLVTTAMRVFKIDATESARVSDVFANAVNRSKLTIDKLRTSFNYVGPIAKAVGVSFEEMSASMMTLANSGLRASTIGTGLRRVFAELADPSSKLAAAAKRAGIALSDLDPKTKGLSTVIGNLGLVVNDAKTAFDIFGKRGAAAVLALSDSKGQFNDMLNTVSESGTAAKQAAIQMEGLGVSFKNLQDKIKLMAVALGEAGIADALRVIIDMSRAVVDAITVMLQSGFAKFVIQAGLFVTAATAVIAVLKSLEIVAGLQLFFTMAQGITASALAMITLEGASAALLFIFNPLVALVIALSVGLAVFSAKAYKSAEATKELSDSALKAATEYGILKKKMENYSTSVVGMDKNSNKYAETNKKLRTDLMEVASGLSELADEAEAVVNSIDPLTGAFLDGGAAINEYADAINAVQMDSFVTSLNSSFTALQQGTGTFARQINFMKSSVNDVIEGAAVGITDFVKTAFYSVISPIKTFKGEVGGFADTLKVFENSGAIVGANDFAKAINDGSLSFRDLNDYVESFKGKELNAQMKDLQEYLENIKEKIAPVFQHLRQIGTISTAYTVDEMEKILTSLGLNEQAVDALLIKFKELKEQELGGFSNIVEKWQNDLKDTGNTYGELVKQARAAGLEITEAQVTALKATEDAKTALVDQLDALKAVTAAALDENSTLEEKNAIWKAYYDTLDSILADAKIIQKEYADDTVSQDLNALQILTKNREIELAKANKIFANDAESLQKKLHEINLKFAEQSKKITNHLVNPKTHLADTKLTVKGIKEEYVNMYKAIELQVLSSDKGRKKGNEERRKLEAEEAEKIKNIWVAAELAIIAASQDENAQTRSAKTARLAAQVAEAKLTVTNAKEKADEIAKIEEAAYSITNAKRETAYQEHLTRIDKMIDDNVLSYGKGEQDKIDATLKFYDEIYLAAVEFRKTIDKDSDPERYNAALIAELKAQQNLYKAKGQALSDTNARIIKTEEDAYKIAQSRREASLQEHITTIDSLVTEGSLTHIDGEKEKLKASLQFYRDGLLAAQRYQNSIDAQQDPDRYNNALQERLKAYEEYEKAKATYALKYNDIIAQQNLEAFERANASREVSFSAHNARIEAEIASGILSFKAGEITKLQASLQFYERVASAARQYAGSIDKNARPEDYARGLKEQQKAEEDLNKFRENSLEDYNKKAIALNEDIIDSQKERFSEELKYTEKIANIKEDNTEKLTDLEEDYADSVADINSDLQEKLIDLQEDRVALAKKYADKRKAIEEDYFTSIVSSADDIGDAIDKVNQRGMTDVQKARDNEKIAARELGELEERLKAARRSGNQEEIKNILDRTDKVKDLYSEMSNTGKATSGLKKLQEFKEDVITAGRDASLKKLKQEEILERKKANKELLKVKNLHTVKLTNLNDEHADALEKQQKAYDDSVKKEESRHATAMDNIRIEAAEQLNTAQQVATALNTLTTGKTTTPRTAETSIKPSGQVVLDQMEDTGNKVSNILKTATTNAIAAGVKIEDGLGGAISNSFKKAENGFEEFIVTTDANGKKVITTASTMAQGFTALAGVINSEPLIALENLKTEAQLLIDKTPEAIIKVRTDDGVAKVKTALATIKEDVLSIGVESNGISVIGPGELLKIDEATRKLNFLFEGLNTEDPKQKLQDMITTLKGMGSTSVTTQQEMIKAIQNYANTIEGVDISSVLVRTQEGWGSVIKILDETGIEIEGLSRTVQSNPLDLFPTELKQSIVSNIQDVSGVMSNVQKQIEEKVEVSVGIQQARIAASQTIEAFHNAKEAINDDPVVLGVDLEYEGIADDVRAIKSGISDETEFIPVELEYEGIADQVDAVETDIEGIGDVKPEIDLDIPETELTFLVEQLKDLEDKEISVVVNIEGIDDVFSLIEVLERLDSTNSEQTLIIKTEGEEVIDELDQAVKNILDILANPVVITLAVKNSYKWDNALKVYKQFVDKDVQITEYIRTVKTAAEGGLIDLPRFAAGGFARMSGALSGFGGGDKIKALLEAGEFIVNKFSVKKYGVDFMKSLNAGALDFSNVVRASTGGLITSPNVMSNISKSTTDLKTSGDLFNLNFSFAGDVPQSTRQNAKSIAVMVMAEFEKLHRSRS